MKVLFLMIAMVFTSSLFAQKASFASQSDLVGDLSDALLNDIYHHSLNLCPCDCSCGRSVWVEGFGSTRMRNASLERSRYKNRFGGLLAGSNFTLGDASFSLFAGGSWGEVAIHRESHFDTNSILFGATWERLCQNRFFGCAFAAGYLEEKRCFRDVREEPRGIFLSPEITYAFLFTRVPLCPIFTSTLRYAGFFSRDYQHREIIGTLHVRDRSIQLVTLRSELALPALFCTPFRPYIGAAGRFQADGNCVKGKLLQEQRHFSDRIDGAIVYGFLGTRISKCWKRVAMQGNVEASYDSDSSWRVLGKLYLNYRY